MYKLLKRLSLVFVALNIVASTSELFVVSDHFDGEVFHNSPKTGRKTFMDLLRWRWNRTATKEDDVVAAITPAKPAQRIAGDDIVVTFVGHSTFLLQANNTNVLTDPIWSDRCSPISFIGPKRLQSPGISFDDLPASTSVARFFSGTIKTGWSLCQSFMSVGTSM